MHVVCVVGVVDEPDRAPLTITQDLKHRCIVGHGPTTVAYKDTNALPLQWHGPLMVKLHR